MNTIQRWRVFVLALLGALSVTAQSKAIVRMPSVLGHYMVLQRERPVPIWGSADPGEEVTVTFAGQTKTATTGADRRWQVNLDKLTAGGPLEMVIQGRNKVTLKDIYVGEVWLASGQSNMVGFLSTSAGYEQEKLDTNHPQIRIFTTGQAAKRTPQTDCSATWRVCTPEIAGGFSAVCYYFAKELHQRLGVPVGIVNSSLGSTPIEAWTSLDAQQEQPELQDLLASWKKQAEEYDPAAAKAQYERDLLAWNEAAAAAKQAGKGPPRQPKTPLDPRDRQAHPGVMFNGMIAPLIPYRFRGVIWYQGEFNTQSEDYAALYRRQLPLLIRDWRARWNDELPFAWVQLPNFDTKTRQPIMPGWPLVREGQLLSLSEPKTGIIVAIDIGEAGSVHPRNKRDVGLRLARWALAEVYGEKLTWSGPIYARHEIVGSAIRLHFHHVGGGLVARGAELKGFQIRGDNQEWRPAAARIDGETVLVTNSQIAKPVAVRYSWADNPDGNLFNAAELPASPFRTDHTP